MTEQPRVFEFRMGEREPHTHVVSRSNKAAAELLTGWQAWPGGAMALTGPKGSGKTHLARAWAAAAEARPLPASAPPEEAAEAFEASQGRLVVDDADAAADEMGLIRLLDLARWRHGAVLLVGERDPSQWRCATRDLVSRLSALPAARLEEPDEALLMVVLKRLCRERFIELSDKAASYLTKRMERSFAAADALARELDRIVVKGAKPVTAPQARQALVAIKEGRL
jgi:chromosomal replication initiation ATPase DnaA